MARVLVILALVAPTWSGCSARAKQPPTPAREIRATDLLAAPVPRGERYYLLMFGSQSHPKMPRYTHSWATVVKVTDRGPGCAPHIENHTISWMPASLTIRPMSFRVEPGVNLDLHTSLREMLKHDETIAMWGPYEVWHGMYHRFLAQKSFLESGAIGYQCIDSVGEAAHTGCGCDCIHAITDMDPQFDRRRYPLSYYGIAASRHAVEQVLTRPIVIDAPRTHDWLIPALGLDCYPIRRECYRGKAVPFSPEALAAAAGCQ